MKEAVCQCSENSREKYLDKIETADIIETVMMNQKRVYLYKESGEKTSRIVELDRERRRRKSLRQVAVGGSVGQENKSEYQL